jgi:hypothetical protein
MLRRLATGYTQWINADQDQPAFLSALFHYFSIHKKISLKKMNGLAEIERWTSPFKNISVVSVKVA